MAIESEMEKLLGEVLALQDEDGRGAELTEERVSDVLLGRDAFTADEEYLLATSPLARLIYEELREDLEIEREAAFQRRCKKAGVSTEIALLAASGGRYPEKLSNDDFCVELDRHPISDGWVITLTLKDRVRRIVDPNDVLVLVDDRGAVWLRGQVNRYGEIHSYSWPFDETPAERVQKDGFKLSIRSG